MKRYRLLAVLLFAAFIGVGFTACSDSDDNNDGDNTPNPEGTASYNDLWFFQNAIIEVDTLGNFLSRTCGEVLDVNVPHHLFVGVESQVEAEEIFRQWLAPDVTVTPTANGLSAPLSDEKGNAQGTVYFTAATASGQVAEVTASTETKLLYFDKVTFLLNAAWPVNASAKFYHVGDVITHSPTDGVLNDKLKAEDKTLKFICIRESGNGNKPMFVTTTNGTYACGGVDYYDDYSTIRNSQYCPGESKAKTISEIFRKDWNYWMQTFKANGVSLKGDANYWIDEMNWNWYRFYDAITLSSGAIYGHKVNENSFQFVLKIDWMDDATIYSSLVGTKGSSGYGDEESYHKIFDGLNNTKWCSYKDWRTDGVWFVEFQANTPLKATGYKLTTAGDTEKYSGRNPKAWRLLGRNDEEEDWVEIANETNGDLPAVNGYTKSYSISSPKKYLYYRWEISAVKNADAMQIANFSLVV